MEGGHQVPKESFFIERKKLLIKRIEELIRLTDY
jgi:hypothetical protein